MNLAKAVDMVQTQPLRPERESMPQGKRGGSHGLGGRGTEIGGERNRGPGLAQIRRESARTSFGVMP